MLRRDDRGFCDYPVVRHDELTNHFKTAIVYLVAWAAG